MKQVLLRAFSATVLLAAALLAAWYFQPDAGGPPADNADASIANGACRGGHESGPSLGRPASAEEPEARETTDAAEQTPETPPPGGAEKKPYPSHIYDDIDDCTSVDEWIDNERQARIDELNALLAGVFGEAPGNPVLALDGLDEETLVRLTREHGAFFVGPEFRSSYDFLEIALEIGVLVGENLPPEEWLAWFEEAGPRSGAAGRAAAAILHGVIVMGQDGSLQVGFERIRKVRGDPELAGRVLAIIDAYLAEWRGQELGGEVTDLCLTLEEICPVEGGLALIRKWLVETPYGDEIVEMSLCECLRFWPLEEARQTALDVLATARGGAIKGLIECRVATTGGRESAWRRAEIDEFLEAPLAEAVKKTDSSPAVLYAWLFAGDLLEPRAREIADALLKRRDNVNSSAFGFSFLEKVDPRAAETVWLQWFRSGEEYEVVSACAAAPNLPDIAGDAAFLEEMRDMALDDGRRAEVRAAAALALYQLEGNFRRCLRILGAWLDQPKLPGAMLMAAGSLVLWGPKKEARTFLRERTLDPARQPAEVQHEMLLLATVDTEEALDLCEAEENRERFDDFTRLLVAATAEAMDAERYASRAALLRASCEEVEPAWMKNVRLRITGKSDRAEAEVASHAWCNLD